MIAWKLIAAFILDILFGDPYWFPHPVRIIGKFIEVLENFFRTHFRKLKLSGFFLVLLIVGSTYFTVYYLIVLSSLVSPWLEFVVECLLIYTAISARCLGQEGMRIYKLLMNGDEDEARKALSMIVGRDTEKLDESEIIRATIETIAENTVDGIISPLFYAFVGGAPLALAYKAINTLDSMVGYRNERYCEIGFFSAKTDDIANWMPARLSAILIPVAALFLRMSLTGSIKSIIRDGRKSPSPNSGISESGFAGAIGIQLGGICFYNGIKHEKPIIGILNRTRKRKDIKISIRLMYAVSIVTIAIMILIILLGECNFPLTSF
ncbi:MAG: adenosylcobinamide-phosphate synthase CbiB [Spirochaetota bacterium]|nr:adenosylcobinamide-phosphate synthase CbiB [Spirochaetota bacterium]